MPTPAPVDSQSALERSALERSALFVATLTSFMGPFMISSVNVALPAIQSELNMTAVELSWVATSYLLAVALALLPAGKIADMYGRKKIFSLGLFVYTLASTVAAFATSTFVLLVLRGVQGLGAGMFVTTGMAILTSVFPAHKRGQAIGMYVAAVYIGLSVGPSVGGLLVQQFGWRSIFLLMLPLGAGSSAITFHFLKGEWVDERQQRFDLNGCLIYTTALLALIIGVTILPSTFSLLLVPSGIAGLVVFFYHQKRTAYPLFEVHLFANNRTFIFSSLAALLNYSANFAVTFLMSLYLQYLKGLPPQRAGLLLVAQPIMMALFSPLAGRLSDRIEPRLIASLGMAITVIGMVIFTGLGYRTDLSVIVANLLLLGFGFALFSSPNTSAIMGSVTREHYGTASGIVATMRLMGQMTSMAIATVVLALLIGHKPIGPTNFDQFLISIRIVFTISALLCSAGVAFSLFRGRIR